MSGYAQETASKELRAKASQGLFALFANHPTAPNLVMIAMVVAGIWAATNITVQFFPETVINVVSVNHRWTGASAEDIDEALVEPALDEIRVLEGVDRVTAASIEGFGSITIELDEDADSDALAAEVNSILDTINFPVDADDPVVNVRGFRDSVARILISAPLSRSALVDVANQVEAGLLDAGVTEVGLTGVRSPIIEVKPDLAKLQQLDLSIDDINQLLDSRSTNLPAGELADSGTLVRSVGQATSVEAIRALPVFIRRDGTSIELAEVASVDFIYPDTGREIRRNFNPAIEVVVSRGAGQSALRMNDIVQGYVAGLRGDPKPQTGLVTVFGAQFQVPFLKNRLLEASWEQGQRSVVPSNVSIETYNVRADIINARLKLLLDNGILGLVIVMVMLSLFLNLRTAFWVAVGIPVSFAATFAVMYLTGQSINMISTFGLLITLGIIVDDAIVVGEHADELASGQRTLKNPDKSRPLVALGSWLFVVSLALVVMVGLLGLIPGTENSQQLFGVIAFLAGVIKPLFAPLMALSIGAFILSAILVGQRLSADVEISNDAGFKPKEAAVLAAQRMALPVTAAAITTLLAFAALILVGGRFASIIIAIPLAVIAVVIASLVECFLVLPGHMRHALESKRRDRPNPLTRPLAWFRLGFDWLFDAFRYGIFRRSVQLAVFLRYPVLVLSFLLFLWSVAHVSNGSVGFVFFRGPSDGSLSINYELIDGVTRDDNRAVIDAVELATRQAFDASDVDLPYHEAVEMVLGRVGQSVQRRRGGTSTNVDPNTVGSVSIYLSEAYVDLLDAKVSQMGPPASFMGPTNWFSRQVQNAMPENPLLASFAARAGRFSPGGEDVDVRVLNAEPEVLKQAALAVAVGFENIEGVDDVEDNMPFGDVQLEMRLNALGRALGLSDASLANQVRIALSETSIFSFNQNGQDVEVVVSLEDQEKGREQLDNLQLATPSGGFVTLSQVVDFTSQQSFGTIRREGNDRVVNVTGEIAEDSPNEPRSVVSLLVEGVVPEVLARFDVELTLGGSFEDQDEFFDGAMVAALAALAAIYGILALVFGSFVRPILILLIIPMGFVGMIWGHILHGIDLTMFSVIGFLGLSGIIINDSIVLISTIDRRSQTQSRWTATVDGAVDRLRAVLLTSMTTVGGLTPLIFENSPQADFLLPTTLTIVYGLGIGTVWVLYLVPVLVAIQADLLSFEKSRRRLFAAFTSRRSLMAAIRG